MDDANDFDSIADGAEKDNVFAYRPHTKPRFQVISRSAQFRILREHPARIFEPFYESYCSALFVPRDIFEYLN
jgi:hypothetical protein